MDAIDYRGLREAAGMTQKELAQRAGLSVVTVRRVEGLKGPIKTRTRRAVLRALGLVPTVPLHAEDGACLIELSDGSWSTVDAEEFERLGRYRWSSDGTGYAHRKDPRTGQELQLHREIMNAPPECEVHHRDGDPRNNRKANLVLIPVAQHRAHHNREYPRAGGPYRGRRFKGVYPSRRASVWLAKIWLDGRERFLGSHQTPEEAAVAYDAGVIEFRGKGMFTNLIPNP